MTMTGAAAGKRKTARRRPIMQENEGTEMEKDKKEVKEVKMVNVTRAGKESYGGPTEATIPETSLESWAKNGWKIVPLLLVLLCFGNAQAETWNSAQTFNEPVTINDTVAITGAVTQVGASTITGAVKVTGNLTSVAPAAQTIAAGNTITADACGGVKMITAAGAVTTDTTNSFTAPTAALSGCCMTLFNSGDTNSITIDENTLTDCVGTGNLAVTALDAVTFCCDGTTWRQVTALLSNN